MDMNYGMNSTDNSFDNITAINKEEDLENEERIRNWIYIVFGVLAIASNCALLALLFKEKKLRSKNKYIAGYALGSAILGVGYIVDHGRQLEPNFKWPTNMPPLMCMVNLFHITLFKIGDMVVVISILYMSIDGFTAIAPGINPAKKDKTINVMGWLILVALVADVIYAWIAAATSNTILPICYHRATVGELSFRLHYWSLVVMGYLSVLFYISAIIMLKRRKSTSSGIREIQMKREYEVMKQVVLIILNSFLLETVPITIELTCSFLRTHPGFAGYIWLLQVINLSVFAVFRMMKHPAFHKTLKKIYNHCICRVRRTSRVASFDTTS